MNASKSQQVEQAIATLKSFRDGEFGVACVVACGEQAIPALHTALFQREPSGLYQARCRAVEALAALGAHNVLIEFLEADRKIADPIERVGEDAVINAAASALANTREEHVFELLLRLAKRACLTGVIGGLSAYRKVEAVPGLLNALEEDASRPTAEAALKRLGEPAYSALLRTVHQRLPSREQESESSVRRRRSALRLLAEMGIPCEGWPSLRPLMHDLDAKVAALTCEIGLDLAPVAESTEAVGCLIALLAHDDWMLQEEIKTALIVHFKRLRGTIERYLNELRTGKDVATTQHILSILRRVIAEGNAHQP
jgi:hypothetical protein